MAKQPSNNTQNLGQTTAPAATDTAPKTDATTVTGSETQAKPADVKPNDGTTVTHAAVIESDLAKADTNRDETNEVATETAALTNDEHQARASAFANAGARTDATTRDDGPPRRGTHKAAEAVLSRLPDHPTQKGAKILDRPITVGADG